MSRHADRVEDDGEAVPDDGLQGLGGGWSLFFGTQFIAGSLMFQVQDL